MAVFHQTLKYPLYSLLVLLKRMKSFHKQGHQRQSTLCLRQPFLGNSYFPEKTAPLERNHEIISP